MRSYFGLFADHRKPDIILDYAIESVSIVPNAIHKYQVKDATINFGEGNVAQLFSESIKNQDIWGINQRNILEIHNSAYNN